MPVTVDDDSSEAAEGSRMVSRPATALVSGLQQGVAGAIQRPTGTHTEAGTVRTTQGHIQACRWGGIQHAQGDWQLAGQWPVSMRTQASMAEDS